jgi:hypothetical protein
MRRIARLRGSLSPTLTFVTRLVGVLGVALLVGCGEAEPTEEMGETTAALGDDAYIGDQGGARDPREVDPTKTAGRLHLDKTIEEAPARVVLEYTWQGQPNGYWCGPGSTRMAIGTRLKTPPSQTELATFLGTTTDGTARIDTIRALNAYLVPHWPYQSIPVDTRPTQQQRDFLKQTIIERLSTGWPVVANVLSGWRPPGYPSGTIGHFVAVVGYEQSGERVLIADPAGAGSAGPRWENVPKTYWITLQNLGTWVGGRGYSG